jgi:glycosyltransferase involved in cell wall biosynthesis
MKPASKNLRLTRVIARLNIGGPAIQAITLTKRLEEHGYVTRLVRGVESPSEGNMDYLAERIGVSPTSISQMRRDPGFGDLIALARLVWILRTDRPAVLHTHAAKGGTLGRVAALIAFPLRSRRPVIVHTYHGHSLTGYFSGRTAGIYRIIERLLAHVTDRLVAVSDEVRSDLVGLAVASESKFEVVRLGFDLSPFTDDLDRAVRRSALRREWGVADDELLLTLVARLVPIKRVDRFLRVARELGHRPGLRFAIAGDGELRTELQASTDARALGDRLVWAGFRRDVNDVCFASDVIMLTSDNEGTPVSLIEAQAAAVPVVATDVGGVRSAVRHGVTGLVIDPEDVAGLATGASGLLDDPKLRADMGAAGRAHATGLFTLDRLVADHVRLYAELLAAKGR